LKKTVATIGYGVDKGDFTP